MRVKHPGPPVPVPYSDGKPKRVLKTGTQASANPCGHQFVSKVYPNAIEVPGQLSAAKGMGVLVGLVGLLGASFASIGAVFGIHEVLTTDPSMADYGYSIVGSILSPLVGAAFFISASWFFRKDLFTYRDEPVLFNRATRKVHLFRRRERIWPFAPWPLVIDTYEWDCVRGEISGGLYYNGATAAVRYQLYLAIKDSPKGKTFIDRFVVGTQMSDQNSLTDNWEHIRRYMEEDGPPLQAGEWRDDIDDTFSHREAWSTTFPFLSRDRAIRHSVFFHVLMVVGFPFMFCFGFCRWLAEITCRPPFWTPEILAAAGGAPLSDEALRALIPPKPEEEKSCLSEDERAYAKQQATKPKVSPEMKKTGLVILGILIAMALVKYAQMQMRGY